MEAPSVCIVILNFNGWKDTIECIQSISALNYENYKLVIIDNNSPDGSEKKILDWLSGREKHQFSIDQRIAEHVDIVDNRSIPYIYLTQKEINEHYIADSTNKDIIFIQAGENRGYSAGNNIGIRYALKKNFDYIWILNNDTLIPSDTLTKMINHIQSNGSLGIVGCRLFLYHNPDRLQCEGGYIHNQLTGRVSPVYNYKEIADINDKQGALLFFNTGASFLIDINVFAKIGLLDEDYFIYFEESDLTVKALRKGFKISCATNAFIFHKEGATIQDTNTKTSSLLSDYYSVRNRIIYTLKNNPKYIIPIYLSLLIVLLKRMQRKEWRKFINVIKIILNPYRQFKK